MHFELLHLLRDRCDGRYYLSTGHPRLVCLIRSSGSYLLVCIPLSFLVQLLVTATFSCSKTCVLWCPSHPVSSSSGTCGSCLQISWGRGFLLPPLLSLWVLSSAFLTWMSQWPPSWSLPLSLLCSCSVLSLTLLCLCCYIAMTLLWPYYVLYWPCYDLALSLIWSCPVLLWPCYDIAMTLLCPCSDLAPLYMPSVQAQCSWRVHPLIEASVVPPTPCQCFAPVSCPGLSGLPAEMLHTWLHCQLLHDASGFVLEPLLTLTSFTFLQTSYHYLSSMYLSVCLSSIHLSSVYLSIYSSGFQRVGHNWATELNWTYLIYILALCLFCPLF